MYLLGSVSLALLAQLAILHMPWMQMVFRTEPLSLELWGIVTAVSATILVVAEIDKIFIRRKRGQEADQHEVTTKDDQRNDPAQGGGDVPENKKDQKDKTPVSSKTQEKVEDHSDDASSDSQSSDTGETDEQSEQVRDWSEEKSGKAEDDHPEQTEKGDDVDRDKSRGKAGDHPGEEPEKARGGSYRKETEYRKEIEYGEDGEIRTEKEYRKEVELRKGSGNPHKPQAD